MNVLVTGGTGLLGSEVVKQLRVAGHRARVLSRTPGDDADRATGDIATGAGLDASLAGIEAVVHAASATRNPTSMHATDVRGTRNLLEAAARAGVRHVLYVSIVGIEGVAYPYYRYKLQAEGIIKEGIAPWSILRATQFHPFMEFVLGLFVKLPGLATVPRGWLFQPVDVAEVAARVTEVVTKEPQGVLPDFGGPEIRRLDSLAEPWLAARHSRRKLVNLALPLKAARQIAEGRLTCPENRAGTATFEQYLVRRYGEW